MISPDVRDRERLNAREAALVAKVLMQRLSAGLLETKGFAQAAAEVAADLSLPSSSNSISFPRNTPIFTFLNVTDVPDITGNLEERRIMILDIGVPPQYSIHLEFSTIRGGGLDKGWFYLDDYTLGAESPPSLTMDTANKIKKVLDNYLPLGACGMRGNLMANPA